MLEGEASPSTYTRLITNTHTTQCLKVKLLQDCTPIITKKDSNTHNKVTDRGATDVLQANINNLHNMIPINTTVTSGLQRPGNAIDIHSE